MEERRRRTRVPVQFEATVEKEGRLVEVDTENISLNGMRCQPDDRLQKGDRGKVRIALSPDVAIVAQCKIIRSDSKGIAIAFEGIQEDSFFHLKKLVQYNMEDADIIDEELRKAGFE